MSLLEQSFVLLCLPFQDGHHIVKVIQSQINLIFIFALFCILDHEYSLPLICTSIRPGARISPPQSISTSACIFSCQNTSLGSRILPLLIHKSSLMRALSRNSRQLKNLYNLDIVNCTEDKWDYNNISCYYTLLLYSYCISFNYFS